MKNFFKHIAVPALVVVSVVGSISFSQASEYSKNEIIVKYRKNAVRERMTMNAFYEQNGIESVYHFTGLMSSFEKLTIKPDRTIQDALKQVLQDPLVEYAQPNYILRIQPVNMPSQANTPCTSLFGCKNGTSGGGWPSNPNPQPTNPAKQRPDVNPAPVAVNPPVEDTRSNELYGLDLIHAREAWKDTKGSQKVIVADIDTGIDYNHEDLGINLWRNGKDKHGDIVGYDFIHNDNLPFDDHMHGTHTAGTIGAAGGNGKGVIGVSPNVTLMALKFLSGEGSGTTADAIRAIDFAVQNGAKILSNSWGGPKEDDNQALLDSVNRAKDKGVLFVVAAGNESSDNDTDKASYPAAFNTENMISVAATDRSDKLAYFSNVGKKSVHLAAPGVKILSTIPGDAYKEASGTSMACPHVAGAAALVWSKHPEYNFKQVKEALLNTVDPLETLKDKTITGGRLNIEKALKYTSSN